ncbi:patatin family protein [Corynebacterium frankenforstense]|uniref:patatin-like phospholipase family protein n=1 Tax=Corynebacterium frankenforstense TaxID=1230998 RepID=UPI0026EACAE6|nr:patatin family protein [Corynebacterium frankenforstense]
MSLNAPTTALVLEGGGMRGVYTAGVLDVLLANDVRVGWVGGISAGATNTVAYLDGDREQLHRNFVEAAQEPEFAGLSWFLRGKGFFHSEYIYAADRFPERPRPEIPFRIGAVDAQSGEHVYWSAEDVDGMVDLFHRVRASSSLPVIMPPTEIDGRFYVDGALGPSGGIPVDAAEADGFERFLVILTRPPGFVRPPLGHPRAIRALLRRRPAVAERLLTRHERYNATMAHLRELKAAGRAYLFAPEGELVSSRELDEARLSAAFDSARAQAEREWPAIAEFLARGEGA